MDFNFNFARIRDIEKELAKFMDENNEDSSDDAEIEESMKRFGKILRDTCALVRDAALAPDFQDLLIKADELINKALAYAHGKADIYELVPSFAHSDANPEVDSKPFGGSGVFSHGDLAQFLPILHLIMGRSAIEPGGKFPKEPDPWAKSMKPHPLTSRLSRFKGDVEVSVTPDTPIANAIYGARCEITDESISLPIRITMSPGGSCFALSGMGGWKNRSPVLQYYFVNHNSDTVFPQYHGVETGLSDIAYWTAIDETRKLIFAADTDRVKSFAWGLPNGTTYDSPLATHTMDSGKWDGPIAILPEGRFIRAGKGSAGVWNIDSLQTHGPEGDDKIGDDIDTEDTSRDDEDLIELSSGSTASNTIAFEDTTLTPSVWHNHPIVSSAVFCGSDPRKTKTYSFVILDLEHGGKIITRYLGHGDEVIQISTSPGDQNTFVTTCHDGYARIFDIRQPLPTLTFDIGQRTEECPAAVLAHPDGIPTMFTGAGRREEIRLWDIRARSVVYELSTGNNAVASLAWDTNNSTLYAATECRYIDRLGYNHDYRRAKVPADQRTRYNFGNGGDEDEDIEDDGNDDDDDDDDDDDEERCWPKGAYHGETYFGYLFDAGDHRIYRYAFKEIPETILPTYGQATLNSDYW